MCGKCLLEGLPCRLIIISLIRICNLDTHSLTLNFITLYILYTVLYKEIQINHRHRSIMYRRIRV